MIGGEALAYVAVGGVAIGGARFLSDLAHAKLDAWVERRARIIYGPRYVDPQTYADVTFKTMQPAFTEMVKIDATVHGRVVSLEKKLDTLIGELRAIRALAGATTPPKSTYKAPLPVIPAAGYVAAPPAPEPEPEPWNWKQDQDLRAIAREVVDGLVKYGQKKPDAEANVLRALERQTGPGASFDEIFTEAFKK